MEQVLAPRFNFTPKNTGKLDGYDYGSGGCDPSGQNIGYNQETGQLHIEINGLAEPTTNEARRIVREDLLKAITAFVQDKPAVEQGLFNPEAVPEEQNVLRMGKIVRDRYPELSEADQEAIRQHAVAALNLTQQARNIALTAPDTEATGSNTAFVDSVCRYALDVTGLDIDLVDGINPFAAAYSILSKSMSE
jgi:hypothetical protein